MGLYDIVQCEVPIPGEPKPKYPDFQTKDLYCCLETYTIQSDGTLTGPWGLMKFHGRLRFYTFESSRSKDPKDEYGIWYEYEANFQDGKLATLDCVEIHKSYFGNPVADVIYRRPHA